jgi:hypothetical protein
MLLSKEKEAGERFIRLSNDIGKARRKYADQPEKILEEKIRIYPELIKAKRERDGFDPNSFGQFKVKVKTKKYDNSPDNVDIVGTVFEKDSKGTWREVSSETLFASKEGRYWLEGPEYETLTEIKNRLKKRLEKEVLGMENAKSPSDYYTEDLKAGK